MVLGESELENNYCKWAEREKIQCCLKWVFLYNNSFPSLPCSIIKFYHNSWWVEFQDSKWKEYLASGLRRRGRSFPGLLCAKTRQKVPYLEYESIVSPVRIDVQKGTNLRLGLSSKLSPTTLYIYAGKHSLLSTAPLLTSCNSEHITSHQPLLACECELTCQWSTALSECCDAFTEIHRGRSNAQLAAAALALARAGSHSCSSYAQTCCRLRGFDQGDTRNRRPLLETAQNRWRGRACRMEPC